MSGLVQDLEQDFSGGDQSQGSFDQGSNQQGSNQQGSGGSSGGFMKEAETGGEDIAINQEINNFANKEGVPSGLDAGIDNFADKEIQKEL